MLKDFTKWTLLSLAVGFLSGAAAWAFLTAINSAIEFRKMHSWMIAFLPLVGALVAWFYHKYGREIEGGNNLILDEIHEPKKHLPFRMVPMIFFGAVLSHLFGASVGREGAAVQMGSGISDQFSKFAGKVFNNRRIVLMTGMSAGFAAIFGTPIAGTIFGIEILMVGSLAYEALFPCMVAAITGNLTALWLGIQYAHYGPIQLPPFTVVHILSAAAAGVCFGLAARFFIWLLHVCKKVFSEKIPNPILRPFFGGLIIALIFFITNSDRYLSLGEEVINSSFVQRVFPWDFLCKMITTSLSIGAGFKGGEVMSLFYMGATLGNTLSQFLPLSLPLMTALGFVSVFAGAANTPIACIFLALKLFGSEIGVYAAIAIVMSYLVSGKTGIYHSQRKHLLKKI
jgi:H+/Cl- antiporter ClcA